LKITRGYIQGAFDGEGSLILNLSKRGDHWRLHITNTDLVWLQGISKYLKSKGYHPRINEWQNESKPHWKRRYNLILLRRSEIKRFLQEFPPLMAARQKKAAEFLLWDKQHKRLMPKGSDSVLQQALDILEGSNNQGRLL